MKQELAPYTRYGGKTFVGADSWNGQATYLKVLFLGLKPGKEEARIGLPFVDPIGRF